MADTIARVRINIIVKANRKYNRENSLPVDIEEKCTFGKNKVEFAINWGAIGTVDSEKAYDFADYMKFIARLVDELNRLELVYDYDAEDPAIKDEEGHETTFNDVYTWYKERRYSRIARFLEEGII